MKAHIKKMLELTPAFLVTLVFANWSVKKRVMVARRGNLILTKKNPTRRPLPR
jgi:hypothetical protein